MPEATNGDEKMDDFSGTGILQERSEEDSDDDDAGLPIISTAPAPITCGGFDLQVNTSEGADGLEYVNASLRDLSSGSEIAHLQASYLLRPTGADFRMLCKDRLCAHEVLDQLFDEVGVPRQPLLSAVSKAAHDEGFLIVENVHIETSRRGKELGLEFMEAVVRCFTGPLRRVSLVMCAIRPGSDSTQSILALERYWARLGIQRLPQHQHIWFTEPSKFTRRLAKEEVTICRPVVAAKQTGKKRTADGSNQRSQARKKAATTRSRASLAENRSRNGCLHTSSEPTVDYTKLISEKVPPLSGRLSPRMCYLLLQAAETGAEVLRTDINSFKDGEPGLCYWGCECFPKALRSGVFKAFVKGMIEIVELIAVILKMERLPTDAAVRGILSPFGSMTSLCLGQEFGLRLNKHMVSHFFSKGGRVQHVIEAIIEESMRFFEEQDGLEDSLSGWPEYHTLPAHELDGNFDAIRQALTPQMETVGLQGG